MDASRNFSGVITAGIQDVSALLPLLGTEQCEKHLGSALDRGFLYSSVTPISIFGSLGTVRAAFNILVASVNIQQYLFLGAKKLHNGGFNASGVVAPMITLDPHHAKRFLAESRLEKMLNEEHIENVEDLTVSWGEGIVRWNLLLVAFTLVISTVGLLPYIFIIHDHQHAPTMLPFFGNGFGFPILRVVGSALCVNVAQFLVQIRILVLLKTRLLFVTIDRLAKQADINLKDEIDPKIVRKKGEQCKFDMWNSDMASEKCIWALEKWLAASQTVASTQKGNDIPAAINDIYMSQYQRHFESFHNSIPPWLNPMLCISLVAGILSTVAGYIGCFYLIQNSLDSTGPLLWLILETLLSIIRIVVWAVNPSWDDSKGIVFELQLASHAPLITCNKLEGDIIIDGIAPVTRSKSFLGEVVAYTGPLPPINMDGVTLYYILAAEGESLPQSVADTLPRWKLYVVLSDFREPEKTSRVFFKQCNQETFSIRISMLEPVSESTAINVRAKFDREGITDPKTHALTEDASFMDDLTAHYDEIIFRLQKQKLNLERKAFFDKTWDMLQPAKRERYLESDATQGSGLGSELVTDEDVAYLRQGQVERRVQEMYSHLEEWIGLYITHYTQELLQDMPVNLVSKENESVSVVQKHEANEIEYLLIACQTYLEQLLMSTAAKWDEFVETAYDNMVNAIIEGTFSKATGLKKLSENCKQHGEEIRKGKLESRLANEWDSFLEKEICLRRENMHNRLATQADLTEQRISRRKYHDPTGETIVRIWRSFDFDMRSSGLSSQPPTASNASLDEFEGHLLPITPDDRSSLSNAGECSHLLSQGTNMYSPQSNTVVRWQDAFRERMQKRFSEVESNVSSFADKIDRKNEYHKLELMKSRCHQRINQLFSRMEHQIAEFEDLHHRDILISNSHKLVEYWSTESLQERLRLLNRMQKFVAISDTSVRAVGGPQNMVRALIRSQDFSFIDVTESEMFMATELVEAVKGLKSVTGVALSLGAAAEKEALQAVESNVDSAVAAKQDVCFFKNATVTDYFRKGHPYLHFRDKGESSCIVYFHTNVKCDHILTLQHCTTMSNGKVDIYLNSHALESTWGRSQAVRFGFTNEAIHLPEAYLQDVGQPNILNIVLAEDSEGLYWFSNVFLPVQPIFRST